MSEFESIILGAVQGITEFLPISSSAHLIVLPWFFKVKEGGITFDVMLHFGTLLAILTLYGRKFLTVLIEGLHDLKEKRLGNSLLFKIIAGTLPAVVCGLLFKGFIESHLRTPYVAVFGLIAVSIMMIVCERIYVSEKSISYPIAIGIGIAQALALVPGTSRSGITIVVGMLLGLKRTQAVDFSFLLSIPIILGASLYESRHIHFHDVGAEIELLVLGVASSFIFGLLSLKFLIRFLKKHSLDVFAVYRIGLALIILLFSK
ncbi:MAG: undecaprenyl-diphosphate phosphatase [Proteobacteria bacterium]|nr:undecaprenyl-diphosphate phosphatase [Pseudomonadota bacterium]